MYCIVLFYRAAYLDKVIQTTSVYYSGEIESTAREREIERVVEKALRGEERRGEEKVVIRR